MASMRIENGNYLEPRTTQVQGNGGPWSIILAGGEGERIRPFVYRWLKRNKPKQSCAFVGTRSMLQHTLARADRISIPERQVTVIRRTHVPDARPQFIGRSFETVILQPENRDTGAGIFLPLTYVRARDPNATVVIHPSDHFIYPEKSFIEVLKIVARAAEYYPDRLVLIGARPDSPEPDYGWIIPGDSFGWVSGRIIRNVRSFVEKPSTDQARNALECGGVWNTMIFAAKADTLWSLGLRCFPHMMLLFERLGRAIGTSRENDVLDAIYKTMPVHNFSRGLIARVVEQVALIELNGVFWSDWGRPERIGETLRRMKKTPAFPWACLLQSDGTPSVDH